MKKYQYCKDIGSTHAELNGEVWELTSQQICQLWSASGTASCTTWGRKLHNTRRPAGWVVNRSMLCLLSLRKWRAILDVPCDDWRVGHTSLESTVHLELTGGHHSWTTTSNLDLLLQLSKDLAGHLWARYIRHELTLHRQRRASQNKQLTKRSTCSTLVRSMENCQTTAVCNCKALWFPELDKTFYNWSTVVQWQDPRQKLFHLQSGLVQVLVRHMQHFHSRHSRLRNRTRLKKSSKSNSQHHWRDSKFHACVYRVYSLYM